MYRQVDWQLAWGRRIVWPFRCKMNPVDEPLCCNIIMLHTLEDYASKNILHYGTWVRHTNWVNIESFNKNRKKLGENQTNIAYNIYSVFYLHGKSFFIYMIQLELHEHNNIAQMQLVKDNTVWRLSCHTRRQRIKEVIHIEKAQNIFERTTENFSEQLRV